MRSADGTPARAWWGQQGWLWQEDNVTNSRGKWGGILTLSITTMVINLFSLSLTPRLWSVLLSCAGTYVHLHMHIYSCYLTTYWRGISSIFVLMSSVESSCLSHLTFQFVNQDSASVVKFFKWFHHKAVCFKKLQKIKWWWSVSLITRTFSKQ